MRRSPSHHPFLLHRNDTKLCWDHWVTSEWGLLPIQLNWTVSGCARCTCAFCSQTEKGSYVWTERLASRQCSVILCKDMETVIILLLTVGVLHIKCTSLLEFHNNSGEKGKLLESYDWSWRKINEFCFLHVFVICLFQFHHFGFVNLKHIVIAAGFYKHKNIWQNIPKTMGRSDLWVQLQCLALTLMCSLMWSW